MFFYRPALEVVGVKKKTKALKKTITRLKKGNLEKIVSKKKHKQSSLNLNYYAKSPMEKKNEL